ncbi:metallophosphoesterase [Saccharothrix algeriensis]|nr:metallophosphoesterase [Saccharothrix algeriensis]QTR05885.1 metallophosphoesterase [Saccharothrix algeriensis]
MVIAHLSDPHFDGGPRATGRVRRVVDHLDALPGPVDAVLVTGDIADHGLAAEYEQAREHLRSRYPVLLLPGNHDERGGFRAALLGEGPGDGPVDRTARVGDAVLALCDSTVPGRAEGRLADDTLDWLDAVLDEGAPTLVCLHHPPAPLHQPALDAIGLRDADRFAAVLRRHDNAVAVLCGHAHTGAATTFAGRPVLVAPALASAVPLPWESEREVDLDQPPAFAFHVLADGRLTTHFRVVP